MNWFLVEDMADYEVYAGESYGGMRQVAHIVGTWYLRPWGVMDWYDLSFWLTFVLFVVWMARTIIDWGKY